MHRFADSHGPTGHAPRLVACAVCLVIAAWLGGCSFDKSGFPYNGQNDNNGNQNQNQNQNTATCGNDVREVPEPCDGADLAGQTCQTQGFDGGTLACLGDCTGLDTSQCTGTGPVCGDGLREGAEACDGADLGGQTCQSEGFYGGTLACAPDCSALETTACIGTCGDGIVDVPEACDGADLSGRSCQSEGFYGGTLACLPDCSGLQTAACTGTCGDGATNGPEACDGADLGGRTCQSEGFYSGTLACLPDCSGFQVAACSGTCGDGVINGPEDCDGASLGGATCADLGCLSGTLTCAANCTFDPTGCQAGHDEDSDGIDDNCDNCPTYANAGQADTDSDGLGDACEAPGDGALFTHIQVFDPMLSTAASWTVVGGTWTYGGDVVSGSRVGTGGNYLHATSIPNVDYSVEATFHYVQAPPSGNNWVAVVFAWSQPGVNLYAYECVYEREAKVVSVYRTTGGEWIGIAQASVSTTVVDAQWHRLRVYRDGNVVRCEYTDQTGASGTAQITGTDVAANMSGLIGLRVYNEHTVFRSFVTYQ